MFLVGIEFFEDAVELPVFRHPPNAAYILGPEMGNLSPKILQRCRHVIKIPTSFSLNVATTGAIILYDRIRTLGKLWRTSGKPFRRAFAAPWNMFMGDQSVVRLKTKLRGLLAHNSIFMIFPQPDSPHYVYNKINYGTAKINVLTE